MAKFKLPVTLALGLVLMLGSAVGAEDRDVEFVLDFISFGRHRAVVRRPRQGLLQG